MTLVEAFREKVRCCVCCANWAGNSPLRNTSTCSGESSDLKIDRARTRTQRARNWALRKAEELAKIEAQRRGVTGPARIDFTMPVRRVFVGDELAFAQKKDELRGTFVDVFAACALPP